MNKHSSLENKTKSPPFVFLTVIWVLIALLALEVIGRFIHFVGEGASNHYSSNWELRKVTEAFHIQLWEEPWINYKPGRSVSFKENNQTYFTTINAIGFRGELLKESGFNIACIGGSTTVNGPTDDTTYPALLKLFLEKEYPSRNFGVLNCGVAGMDSDAYFRTIQQIDKSEYKPSIAIEYNAINSICWKMLPFWEAELNSLQKLILKSYFIKYFLGHLFIPNEEQIRKDIRNICMSNILELQNLLNKRNIELLVSSFLCPDPSLATKEELRYYDFNVRYWWKSQYISYTQFYRIIEIYNQELKSTALQHDIPYLALAENGDFGPKEFFDICHLRPMGVEKKAYILSQLLGTSLE